LKQHHRFNSLYYETGFAAAYGGTLRPP
jgi:hypothetical protein